MHPLERRLNLLALLLDSRRPLTFEQIRRKLAEGYEQEDEDSAKRMFERDKDALRDVGVPIEVVPTDVWEIEVGYTIPKDLYYLPEIAFTPEELSALFVAARTGGEEGMAAQAVRKLLYGADGGVIDAAGNVLTGEGAAADARLLAVADAVLERKCVAFGYRTAQGQPSDRAVEAYGLARKGSHWYLVGLDRERGDIRAFRLSRFSTEPRVIGDGSDPPEGFRAADHVQAGPWGAGEPEDRATVAFSPEVAWWAAASVRDSEILETRADGWVVVRLPMGSGDGLASWVLSFGPDAEALDPPGLREEVVRRLEAIVGG